MQSLRPGWVQTRTVLTIAAVGFLALLIIFHYRFHLLWLWQANRSGLGNVQAVLDRPMPESPTPNDWVRCRVDRVEFSLPPELAGNRVANGGTVVFQHGSRAVAFALPSGPSELENRFLQTASELSPDSQKFTMPLLRRACYQASSNDFHWSMTPNEVRWLAFRVTTSKLIRTKSDGHTESFSRQDLDGIIHFCGERSLFFWQSNDGDSEGYMHLVDRSDKADPAWIRAVCQSLKEGRE